MAKENCKLKVYYSNVRSIRNKLGPEFSDILVQFDIIILTETWLKSTDTFEFQDFATFRCDRADDSGYGGVLILIRKSLKFEEFTCRVYVKIESVFVTLRGKDDKKTRFGVVYSPPNCSQEAIAEISDLFSNVLSDSTACFFT